MANTKPPLGRKSNLCQKKFANNLKGGGGGPRERGEDCSFLDLREKKIYSLRGKKERSTCLSERRKVSSSLKKRGPRQ